MCGWNAGLHVKTTLSRGGTIENIVYRNNSVSENNSFIGLLTNYQTGDKLPVGYPPTVIKNLSFVGNSGAKSGAHLGCSVNDTCTNVTFVNNTVAGNKHPWSFHWIESFTVSGNSPPGAEQCMEGAMREQNNCNSGEEGAGSHRPLALKSTDESCQVFVAVNGSDDNSGTSVSSPFKTLQRAIYYGDPTKQTDRTICLRAGIHRLSTTVSVSGNSAHQGRGLTISTYPPDIAAGLGRAQLSGGIVVGPFTKKSPSDAWLTAAPPAASHHRPSIMWMHQETKCQATLRSECSTDSVRAHSPFSHEPCNICAGHLQRELKLAGCTHAEIEAYCSSSQDISWSSARTTLPPRTDEMWLQRARLPKANPIDEWNRFTGDASTYRYAGPLQQPSASKVWPEIDHTGFKYNLSDPITGLYREDEVQALHFHAWTAFWSNVSSIANGELKFRTPTNTAVGQWSRQGGQRYLLENVREGMTGPGDWYWDSGRSEVNLIPPPGLSDATSVFATAAQLETLMQITSASHVTLRDIEFLHADVGDRVDKYYVRG